MSKKSRPLNLGDFDAIDLDPDDDPTGNHAHCGEHGIDEQVVDEVLSGEWVNVEMAVYSAEFAVVGPNAKRNFMWTLLFDTSWKRGDWLRPVTGWDSKPKDIREWERVEGIGARGKEEKMSKEQRDSEMVRQERAQAHAGEVIANSGRRGGSRRMAQVVSVRLDGELIGRLKAIAIQRNATVSELLREGAELVVKDAYANTCPRTSFTIYGAREAVPTVTGRALATS